MPTALRSPLPRPLGLLAILAITAPLTLAACGGSSATNTSAATTPTAAPRTGSATAPTAAPIAGAATTASGTTTSGTASANTSGDPRGTAPAKRGGGGTLHVLFWQAPTLLNAHLGDTKDTNASRVVLEPLATLSSRAATPDVPVLAKEIPSTQNGELAADGTSVTWKLKDGVKWSDGTPFTSADVQATYRYLINPASGAGDLSTYQTIATLDTPDATTVTITFKAPTATWYFPFSSAGVVLQQAQLAQCTDAKNCPVNTNPIGTGPFKVKSFTPGDSVQYVINDTYREPTAPFFDAIDWKGGGDAGTAAKAVQTGQADYAWNLQVAPDILKQVTDAGAKVDLTDGSGVEMIYLNFSDPNKEVDGEVSSVKAPNPFISDPLVRQALSDLIDRESIAKNLYGPAGTATCNLLRNVPPQIVSHNTQCAFDVAKANQLLDQAGWAKGSDGIRAKNGVKMNLTFRTSVNPTREKEEQVIKAAFQQAGIGLDLRNADASVFFGQPDNPDALVRFQTDLEMLSNSAVVPDAGQWFEEWTTAQIAQKANNWKATNDERYSDPQYDALVVQLAKELNPDKRIQLAIACNDYLISHNATIPIVNRLSAAGRRADLINTNPTPWDFDTWNIAYWQLKK